jgi:hypothetical protein
MNRDELKESIYWHIDCPVHYTDLNIASLLKVTPAEVDALCRELEREGRLVLASVDQCDGERHITWCATESRWGGRSAVPPPEAAPYVKELSRLLGVS